MKIKNKELFFPIVILSPIIGYILGEVHDIWSFILYAVAGTMGALLVELGMRSKAVKKNNDLVDLASQEFIEPITKEVQVVVDTKWGRKKLWTIIVKISALSVVVISAKVIILNLAIGRSFFGNRFFDLIAISCSLVVSFWLVKSIKISWNLKEEKTIKGTGLSWKCSSCGSLNVVTIKICPYCRS